MKASVSFLSTGVGFDSKEINKYGHGFLMAAHIREKLTYILYASQRHPSHQELSEYFLRHHDEYQILGGGGIVVHRGDMKLYPLSSIGYIPMQVAQAILPLLQKKLLHIGITKELGIKSHEDDIKDMVKILGGDWEKHIQKF